MKTNKPHDLRSGSRNLLYECLEAKTGDSLLLLCEDPNEGFYDAEAPTAVAREAKAMGIHVTCREVPIVASASDADSGIWDEVGAVDHAVFFARLGDQVRFETMRPGSRPTIVYAVDAEMLGSDFGSASYHGFVALKNLINRSLEQAENVRVTCPLGTDYQGKISSARFDEDGEVSIKRFPMSVFKPVDARPFTGKVALSQFLVGTGSRYYSPYAKRLDGIVHASIENGRVGEIDGPAHLVQQVRSHSEMVGEHFGIDPWVVHSWHAGIHPGCSYKKSIHDNYERWSGAAFGNPRLLHFHTCGDYPPGEISWNVLDPTLAVDGVKLWESGRLHPERILGGQEILDEYPDLDSVFANPRREIGI